MANQREVDFDALLHRGIGKPLGDPVAVRLGDLFPNLGQVILTIGLLDMREQLCAVRIKCVRRRSRSRVARMAAG